MSMALVSYDLHGDKDYEELFEAIKALGNNWCRALESLWLLVTDLTPEEIRNQLVVHMDGDDELFIIDVTSDTWASYLDEEVNGWLRDYFFLEE